MSLLVAAGLEKSYGALTLLQDLSLRLEWRQRVGLVGPNGIGKTTLLRILAGDLEPDRGSVALARGIRVGWLRQEMPVSPDATVLAEAEAALEPVTAMERTLRECEAKMASAHGPELDAVMDAYWSLHDRYEAMGGYDAMRDVSRVLSSMGFATADFSRPVAQLSGGQKTRLALARILLSGSEILLLDEPTNHLDLDATEWLEGFLRDFGGALIVVSHDRRFLDNVVTSIAELDRCTLTLYKSGFSSYWNERQARLQQATEDAERRAAEIARLEEFWRRNKAGQNRNQAWSKLKAANRLREQASQGPSRLKDLRVTLAAGSRSGNEVVIAERLTKRFGEVTLFRDLSLLVTRGQRIGVVGPNGSGKSTLLRTIIGVQAPTSGRIRLGASVSVGYFAQEASELDPEMSVIEAVQTVQELSAGEARSFLAKFLFTGDDVFKCVEQLSGGEKNRLVLAQLVLARPNLLILDEPTNHLDIAARDALTRMLQSYDGTLIVASHDRHLLDETTAFTLVVADGHARLYDGKYSAYRDLMRRSAQRVSSVPAPAPDDGKERPRNSFELTRARRRASKEIERTEQRVAELEDWLRRIEECLSHPGVGDDVVRLAIDHEQAHRELAQAMTAWETAVTEADGLGVPI